MDGRPIWTDCDEAGDYVVPNVLSPRDLVFRPDNMDETEPHTSKTRNDNPNRMNLSDRWTNTVYTSWVFKIYGVLGDIFSFIHQIVIPLHGIWQ